MNKRYCETMVTLAGVPCVVYLVKVIHRSGKISYYPKISRVKIENRFEVKEKGDKVK